MKLAIWTAIAGLLLGCQSNPGAASSDGDAERIRRVSARVMDAADAYCADAAAPRPSAERRSCRYPVVLANTSNVFASANSERIRVSSGFLHYVMSDAELAFVIAHEAGHIVRNHSPAVSADRRQRQELEADQLGLELVIRAGYDPRAAANLLERLTSSNVIAQSGFAYPSFASRAETLRRRVNQLRATTSTSATTERRPAQ